MDDDIISSTSQLLLSLASTKDCFVSEVAAILDIPDHLELV